MSSNDIGVRVQHLRKSFLNGGVLACDDVNLGTLQN